jgi:hypothetical protein
MVTHFNGYSDFLSDSVWTRPVGQFTYSPVRPNSFQERGQKLVNLLIGGSPLFYERFNMVVPLEKQVQIMEGSYNTQRQLWLDSKPILKPGVYKYFQTNRKFVGLCPSSYHRTEAPRLSAYGSTAHGMKKVLLLDILKVISSQYNLTFLDIDMSACHSRVALSLQGNIHNTLLYKALNKPSFWGDQVSKYKRTFDKYDLTFKECKGLLKIPVYTILNGGNPCSPDNLTNNLEDNCSSYSKQFYEKSPDADILSSELGRDLHKILSHDNLLNELKDLNKNCSIGLRDKGVKTYRCYGVDRINPYVTESAHKCISRVFQSFEVVILTSLVKSCLQKGNIHILSLDHDGVLVYQSNKDFETLNHLDLLASLQESFSPLPHYLLKAPVPLEFKRIIQNGQELSL